MVIFGWIVLFIIPALILAFNSASLIVWSIAYAFFLTIFSLFAHLALATIILWVFFCICALILNILPLRRLLLTRHLFTRFCRTMPQLSQTEQAILGAGNLGWEAELFTGSPDWEKLISIPKPKLTQEESHFLEGPVAELCSMTNDWEICQLQFSVPEKIWNFLKKEKFFGLIIPKLYGGKGFSAYAYSQIITKLASISTTIAITASVPNSLGPAELLLQYGTEEQKNYYLPRLASGKEIPCFALTSVEVVSDASSITDYGIVCEHVFDDKREIAIRLNWNKPHITFSPMVTLIGLVFKLYDPDSILSEKEDLGITCALISASARGVVHGCRNFSLCCPFMNGSIQGKDVMIPITAVIGGSKMIGQGWRMLMECLAAGKSILSPSVVAGSVKRAVFTSGAYAYIQRQFNTSIGDSEGVKHALAQLGGHAFLGEALRAFTINGVSHGFKSAVSSAISKYYTTEYAREVIKQAIDIHRGKGICMGLHNYLAQAYIESSINITAGVANILIRSLIIFGQGIIRSHPYTLREMHVANSDNSLISVKKFDKLFFSHIGFAISNATRSFLLALSGGRLAPISVFKLKYYCQQFSRYSTAFALVIDLSMVVLGRNLKCKERLSERLVNILSYLYTGSAVIKYYLDNDDQEMKLCLQWACETLLYRIQETLHDYLLNMPVRWVAILLRGLIFPLGRRRRLPSDKLSNQMAELFLCPSKLRNILTDIIFIENTTNNPISEINKIFKKVIAVHPLNKKLHSAIKNSKINGRDFAEKISKAVSQNILTQAEGKQLLEAYVESMKIINIDDFSNEDIIARFSKEKS